MANISIPIAKRLKKSRLNAKLSQKKLGILAGIDEFSSSARMNQYEKNNLLIVFYFVVNFLQ